MVMYFHGFRRDLLPYRLSSEDIEEWIHRGRIEYVSWCICQTVGHTTIIITIALHMFKQFVDRVNVRDKTVIIYIDDPIILRKDGQTLMNVQVGSSVCTWNERLGIWDFGENAS